MPYSSEPDLVRDPIPKALFHQKRYRKERDFLRYSTKKILEIAPAATQGLAQNLKGPLGLGI